MGRSTFLKSLAGVGAITIKLKFSTSFKSNISTIDPDVIPSYITVNGENLKLPSCNLLNIPSIIT